MIQTIITSKMCLFMKHIEYLKPNLQFITYLIPKMKPDIMMFRILMVDKSLFFLQI